MEYVDSWVFNRGQELTLFRGPKSWQVTVQLFNSGGRPFRYLKGKDEEGLLLRGLDMIKRDVAKNDEEIELLDMYHDHDTNREEFPISVPRESETLQRWMETPEMQGIIEGVRTNVRLGELEKRSYGEKGGED